MQPRPGVGPVSIGLGAGQPQGRAGLLDGEPGEDAELHDLGRLRLRRREPHQGLIEVQEVRFRGTFRAVDLGEVALKVAAAVPAATLATRPLDQDAAHRLGGGREEVAGVFPGRGARSSDQP